MGAGIYYWLLITTSELCAPIFKSIIKLLKINTECYSWKLFQRVRTFILFIFGLSFFRATSLMEGIKMWKSALAVSMLKQTGGVRKKLKNQNYLFRVLMIIFLLLSVIVFGMYGPEYNATSFICQQF